MYTVFGYTDDCRKFEISFDSFVKAVKIFKELIRGNTVFFKRDKINSCMYMSNIY